jgi:predicted nucleotidyltransferase
VLTELIRRIRAVVEPERVLLFGSAARGELRKDSDLDVLVVVPAGTARRRTGMAIYRHLIGFPLPVDVVVATQADLRASASNFSLVFYPALREGRVIYGHKGSRPRGAAGVAALRAQ